MKLVFDVGGTNTRVAVAANGEITEVKRAKTDPSRDGYKQLLAMLAEASSGHKVEVISGGLPGQLIGLEGEVMAMQNLPAWVGLTIGKDIREAFDARVHINNDVALCGLGEAHFGAGSAKGTMAYYTISTGVNGVRIRDGVIDSPPRRYEMGYQVIDHDSTRRRLSLETMVGGAALEKRLGALAEVVHDPAEWRRVEDYLVSALYNTILYWGPAVIVLGGKMMRDLDARRIERELTTMPKVFESWPAIKTASLEDDAGLRGAAMWLMQSDQD
jgi:predicted NBD/HSP70 family sugar kinase